MTPPPTYRSEIVYDREVREFAMYLDGELIGFAHSYHEAEITLGHQQCPQVIACLFAPIDDYAECASCGDIFGRNSADPLPSVCAACREWADAEIAAHHINTDADELDTDRRIIGGMVLDAQAA